MNKAIPPTWTGLVSSYSKEHIEVVLEQLCEGFNTSQFFAHNGMKMRVVNQKIEAYVEMNPQLIGNMAYQILHGGVAATMLDSIGGLEAMSELYRQGNEQDAEQIAHKVSRLATLDMRVDYLAPGRGQYFIARADTLRLGRKGCTVRMNLENDEGRLIATAIASYAY